MLRTGDRIVTAIPYDWQDDVSGIVVEAAYLGWGDWMVLLYSGAEMILGETRRVIDSEMINGLHTNIVERGCDCPDVHPKIRAAYQEAVKKAGHEAQVKHSGLGKQIERAKACITFPPQAVATLRADPKLRSMGHDELKWGMVSMMTPHIREKVKNDTGDLPQVFYAAFIEAADDMATSILASDANPLVRERMKG